MSSRRPYYRVKRRLEQLSGHPDVFVRRLIPPMEKWALVYGLTISPAVPFEDSLEDRIRRALPLDVWRMVYDRDQPSVLDLNLCEQLTDDELGVLMQHCPFLESLHLPETVANFQRLSVSQCCPRLTHLSVSSRGLTERGLSSLVASCQSLTSLKLEETVELSNEAILILPSRLRQLELIDCWDMSDDGLKFLSHHCPNLTSLTIKGSPGEFTGTGALALASGCRRLTHLKMDSCEMGDEDVRLLARQCPELKSLTFDFDPLSVDLLTQFGTMFPNVEQLVGYATRKTWRSMGPHLGLPQRLTELDCGSTAAKMNDHDFRFLMDQCPALIKLIIHNTDLEELPTLLGSAALSLTHLDLSDACLLTDLGLERLVQRLPQLMDLSLEGCLSLTDESVRTIARSCPRLKRLTLGTHGHRLPQLTDLGITDLVMHCHELTFLSLASIQSLSDPTLCSVIRRCTTLRTLLISTAPLLTDQVPDCIAETGNLDAVLLSRCPKLTEEAIQRLRRTRPLLDVSMFELDWF